MLSIASRTRPNWESAGNGWRTAYALRRSWDVIKEDTFPISWSIAGLLHDLRKDRPFTTIRGPDPSLTPDIYMLGSSTGVQFAVENGLAFVFAAQINAAVPVLKMYKEKFRPSKYFQEPKSMMSIGVFTAETQRSCYIAEPSLLCGRCREYCFRKVCKYHAMSNVIGTPSGRAPHSLVTWNGCDEISSLTHLILFRAWTRIAFLARVAKMNG